MASTDTSPDAPAGAGDKAAFLAKLKSFEGREVGTEVGPDPVNQAMIRHWVEAMGDENPVYTDPDAAAASVHGQVIAPPVMLQAWVMRGLRRGGGAREGGRAGAGGTPREDLMRVLDDAGFTSVVATNCEQEYHRSLHPGDHLSTASVIESVSDEKETGLGTGHFVTNRITYRDQTGEPVATMLFRILKFKPRSRGGAGAAGAAAGEGATEQAAPRPNRPRPAVTQDSAFFFEGAKEGKLLIQRCTACGTLRHPPGPICRACKSYDWDALEASGRGTVYSYVVNHYPQVPSFDYPLPVGLIELEEGTRLVSNIVGIDHGEIRIGMPVQVEFEAFDDELTLPVFRPTAASSGRRA